MNVFACTESKTAPRLDYILSGVSAFATIVLLGGDYYRDDTAMKAWPALGVLSFVSAEIGSKRVDACRAAKLELLQRTDEAVGSRSPTVTTAPPSAPAPCTRPSA